MKGVFDSTEEREAAALIAATLATRGSASSLEAAQYKELADQRFKTLLVSYEEAFLDHGANFYLNVGANPELAYALASLNLTMRKNDRAYMLAIETALASGRKQESCKLAVEVIARGIRNENLKENIAVVKPDCLL